MLCMMGRILVHIAVSMGTLVLSCFAVGSPPDAFSFALAAPRATAEGSGTESAAEPCSDGGSL